MQNVGGRGGGGGEGGGQIRCIMKNLLVALAVVVAV